jgi:hypothetical protein
VKAQAAEPQRLILNLQAKDVKAEFERIKATGATVVKEPYERRGMWIATFADPDGNYFQLMSPARARERDLRARGAVRDLADGDEEARAGARGGEACGGREVGAIAALPAGAAGARRRGTVDRDDPQDVGAAVRGGPRTEERDRT